MVLFHPSGRVKIEDFWKLGFAGNGIFDIGSGGGGGTVGGVCRIWAGRATMDEDMQPVWEVLQPSGGGDCECSDCQPQHGDALCYFCF